VRADRQLQSLVVDVGGAEIVLGAAPEGVIAEADVVEAAVVVAVAGTGAATAAAEVAGTIEAHQGGVVEAGLRRAGAVAAALDRHLLVVPAGMAAPPMPTSGT